MQNIDPIWILEPILFIILAIAPVFYCRYKRRFSGAALLYSFIAYFAAIIAKAVFQLATINSFRSAFGSDLALGIYYGLQTMILEVGLAFLIARYAVSRSKMQAADAEGYGLGLSFWENGVYLGILTLINFVSYYFILSSLSGTSIAQTLYNTLSENEQALFYSPPRALPLISLGVMERASSLLDHFSWGMLCLLAVSSKKMKLFYIALPMGFVGDFLVPFASTLGTVYFELIEFALGLFFLFIALSATRSVRAHFAAVGTSAVSEATSTK